MSYSTHRASSTAIAQVEAQGMSFPNPPADDVPDVPDDITDLDDAQLMALFVQLTAWLDFVAAQVAMAFVDERDAEEFLEVIEAKVLTREWTGASAERVAIAKARASTDEEVVAARKIRRERYGYRKIVENLAASLERNSALVSRELTRRTAGPQPTVSGRRNPRWDA